jgi:ribosomal-protein-alanine N-acetyltransferase
MTLQIGERIVADASVFHQLESSVTQYPWSEKNFADSLLGKHRIFTLMQQDALAGYAIFSLAADEATLLNIAVAANQQGKGLARELLQYGLEQMEKAGAATCFLEVRAGNLRAQGLYHSLGFYEVARRADYYPAETGREDALIMCLPLSAACDELFADQ